MFLAGARLAVLAFIFGPIVRLAQSRRREELADVSGAVLEQIAQGQRV